MSSAKDSVRCMLMPLTSFNILLPNSAVAEIIGYSTPAKLTSTPDWFAGTVMWRGVYVPVVSLESMCEMGASSMGHRSRIAIIYNPEKDDDLPYIGLHIQDIPRAYLAEVDRMATGSDDFDSSKYLIARVDDEQQARYCIDIDTVFADLKAELTPEVKRQLAR